MGGASTRLATPCGTMSSNGRDIPFRRSKREQAAPTAGGAAATRFRPSIANVASLAGVSHQTVSRVLNNHPSVSELTRARVLAAIDQLGYRPNTAARALASGRSMTLGVVALDTSLYGPVSTLLGIQQAAQRLGYFVSVVAVPSIDSFSVREAVRRLTSQSVEGLAVIAPFSSAREALSYLPSGTPVVAVEGDPEAGTSVVTVDQVAGARAATEHLLAGGCKTVHHVAGPPEWLEAGGRLTGWRQALEEAGAEVPPPLAGDWSARSGYQAGHLLAQVPDAHGIFVANDQMALGVLRALHERDRRVPDDVAVVGFDDIPESPYFIPPLTTVRQDFQRVGEAAVQILVDQLSQGDREPVSVVIDPVLVCRGSTLPSSLRNAAATA
ncbi:MAG TPA: LacI family DNA-binding transcriptional regulator [Acidimicrobiales bacterium]|nr:LacI family DNA-binding transcriptional regulator [Acidimicrobiales bacterium]